MSALSFIESKKSVQRGAYQPSPAQEEEDKDERGTRFRFEIPDRAPIA